MAVFKKNTLLPICRYYCVTKECPNQKVPSDIDNYAQKLYFCLSVLNTYFVDERIINIYTIAQIFLLKLE